ncbi:hypothetical protein [Streptomyces sp. B1I3]|uniref:hypothetical protein n=1 Tax=Streptomyces sp. B1I3 TaxID=3042264 RepID=UPI00278ADB47|nr:hypothetical protein [Streptomyces sp. B1I3]MDQ0793557.1 hypothetical protein [Streptomyces sp. B1I3]
MSNFKFEHNGETYEFEKDFSVARSPRWLRANRRRDGMDLVFTLLEEIGGEDVAEAVDTMTEKEFEDFSKKVMKEFSKDAEK